MSELDVGFQEVVHLVRTEEAEVAKLQYTTERPDEQPQESSLTPKGREAMVRSVAAGLSKAVIWRQPVPTYDAAKPILFCGVEWLATIESILAGGSP